MRQGLMCVCSLSIALAAQPLADLPETEAMRRGTVVRPVAKVDANADLTDAPSPAESVQPAGADDVIDRSKFDRVYETGKAVDEVSLTSVVGVTRQFQLRLLAFKSEVSIVTDRATTTAEKSLAADYLLACLQYRLAAALLPRPGLGSLDAMDKASTTLERANKIYLLAKAKVSPGAKPNLP